MRDDERLDRQQRIDYWDQEVIDNSEIGVIGDEGPRDSIFVMAAAALGFKEIKVLSPGLDMRFKKAAKELNSFLNLETFEGYLTTKATLTPFKDSDVLVDLADYNLATKHGVNYSKAEDIPLLSAKTDEEGMKLFTYQEGREWEQLNDVKTPQALPTEEHDFDPVLDMAVTGIALEEVKDYLMDRGTSDKLVEHEKNPEASFRDKLIHDGTGEKVDDEVLVVGAGGLGNIVGPTLAYSGFENITFLDFDRAERHNLNRQIFLYGSEGENKAQTLARRLNYQFNTEADAVEDFFLEDTDITAYDVVFDCVDNHETRINISEAAKDQGVALVSGGTNIDGGQVVAYDPKQDEETPAEYLDLYGIVEDRDLDQLEEELQDDHGEACVERADPSVVMTNQIVGALMVDAYRHLREGHGSPNLFYDSESAKKL